MAVQAEAIYRDRDTIVDLLIDALLARIPDAWTQEDGVIRLLFEVVAGEIEGNYLANELLRNDIFVQLASTQALDQHGEMFGLARGTGTYAGGSVRFSGAGGTFIPTGTQVVSNPGTDELVYFSTTADGTIPNPGTPTALSSADGGAGALSAGTYEYVVTFQTADGETIPGPASTPLVLGASKQVSLTSIPTGGTGTTGRRIYRRVDGGAYGLVATIANNVGTTATDNNASPGALPPTLSTAERVSVTAQADEVGIEGNVVALAINEVVDIPSGVSGVSNPSSFTGGSDPQDTEDYRADLLNFIRAPKSGSPDDLEVWAKEIAGVDEATAFPNDNLGVAQNGHVTVRIIGPDGTVPSADTIAEVQAALESKDVANITIHVATFTPVSTNVTVDVTTETGFALADVTASVQDAISAYITSVPVGGTVYTAGVIDAVFGLNGIANVTTTFTDQTSTSTQKRVPGTITVT